MGEGLKGLRASSWISEVYGFHVICRLHFVRKGGRGRKRRKRKRKIGERGLKKGGVREWWKGKG